MFVSECHSSGLQRKTEDLSSLYNAAVGIRQWNIEKETNLVEWSEQKGRKSEWTREISEGKTEEAEVLRAREKEREWECGEHWFLSSLKLIKVWHWLYWLFLCMQAPLRAQLVIYIFTGLCVATDSLSSQQHCKQTDAYCLQTTSDTNHIRYTIRSRVSPLNSSGVFKCSYTFGPTTRFLPHRSVETGGADKAFSDLSRDAVNQDAGWQPWPHAFTEGDSWWQNSYNNYWC